MNQKTETAIAGASILAGAVAGIKTFPLPWAGLGCVVGMAAGLLVSTEVMKRSK